MKRIVPVIILTLLLGNILALTCNFQAILPSEASDPPPTEWSKPYGGSNEEHAYSVVQTGDGGYALAGETLSYGEGSVDFWLVKTDSSGNMQWSKTYGDSGGQIAYSMIKTSDGGFALAGYTSATTNFHYDFWLVKTDAAGNQLWSKTYGGLQNDVAYSVVQTSDGGYAVAGVTNAYSGSGAEDALLVKTDSSGNMMWSKTYGGASADGAYSIVQVANGGYAIAGFTLSYGVGGFWLVKTDADGNILWSNTYGGPGAFACSSLVLTGDGGYALAGDTQYPTVGYLLVKADSSGNMLWSKTFATDAPYKCSLIQTTDGGYGLAAQIGFDDPDFWFVKTDATGGTMWDATYGGAAGECATSIIRTSDGGYALAGDTCSYGAGSVDFYLVKVGSASPPAGPQITGINPSQPIAGYGRQMLSILGEGFVPDSMVTLKTGSSVYPIPPDRTSFISASKIEIIAGLGADPGLWKALVTNPVNIQSNEYSFQVRSVLDEDIRKVLALALQYWTAEDAVKMTAIAGGESGWDPNKAYDEGTYPFNYMGHDSWGLWQIFMNVHKSKLGELGAPIEDASLTAKWLLNPNNNAKAAYEVWKEAKRIWGDGFLPWSAYTQKNAPSYYKNPSIWNRVINVAKQMGISVFKCPVNVTITDDYGRVISEVENQIPGAIYEYFDTTDTKIFYLPLALTYYVQTNATDNGNITISQITPLESIYEIAFSNVAFNLTSETVAEFDLMPYDANYTLRVDEDSDGLIDYELTPEVEILTTEYDVGITGIVPLKTIIGEGYDLPINMTAMNYGAYTETFNVTIYANDTFIEQQTVILTNGTSTALTFIWNTTGFARGNYTISTYAWSIPGETNTADNTLTGEVVTVAMQGDVNADNIVDIFDIATVALAFSSIPNDPNWNPVADINSDEIVDIFDIVVVALHFGETG